MVYRVCMVTGESGADAGATIPAGVGVTGERLRGTPVVAGVVFGPVVQVRTDVSAAAITRYGDGGHRDTEAALDAYDDAVATVAATYLRRAESSHGPASEVLTASAALARDRGLRAAVAKSLGGGAPLLTAIADAVQGFVTLFASMGGLMAERATDLTDIERRLVADLVGEPEPGVTMPSTPSVLVATDLAPSDTADLDPRVVLALVTERGGPTSHTAIIARQLGLPCVVGASGVTALPGGIRVLVDATTGEIEIGVDPAAAAVRVETARRERAEVDTWTGPGATRDGVSVSLLANVADAGSAREAATAPVDGVGLFRTELCFLDRVEEPSPEEQADVYAEVLQPYVGRGHVVVRTLDAGSDKPVAFASHEGEENPALGVRGLRLTFNNPALMENQLDGIALATRRTGADVWVMAPMVATPAEASTFADAVRARGLTPGVMVEIPSAALMAHRMLKVVDFLSIGTNDLTQYTMAADRMASDLAHLTDPWQPAVLQLIAIAAEAGSQARKPVGVCGEAAADPWLACVLVGMGVTSLSMAATAVRAVGARLATVTSVQCQAAAEAALGADDPAAARAAAREVLLSAL